MLAVRSLSRAYGRCLKRCLSDAAPMGCRFVAFCDAGRGVCLSHGRRSTLWRDEGADLTNCIGKAARTCHNVKSPGKGTFCDCLLRKSSNLSFKASRVEQVLHEMLSCRCSVWRSPCRCLCRTVGVALCVSLFVSLCMLRAACVALYACPASC